MFEGTPSAPAEDAPEGKRKAASEEAMPEADPLEEALAELTAQAERVGDTTEVSPAPVAEEPAAPAAEASAPGPAPRADGELAEELHRTRAELTSVLRERDAALGDAEQLASEVRSLQGQLTLARDNLDRETGALRADLESERGLRSSLEEELAGARDELAKSLHNLEQDQNHDEADRFRAGWERSQQELAERDEELSRLREEHVQERTEHSRAEQELEHQQVEVTRLTTDLEESRGRTSRLQEELDKLREEADSVRAVSETSKADLARAQEDLASAQRALSEAKASSAPVAPPRPSPPAAGAPRVVPTVPVSFLAADGRSVAKQAFFAVGKGEALEAFLSVLLAQWSSAKLPLVSAVGPTGITVQMRGDPSRRSLRILASGAIQVQLSAPELKEIGDLPPLVSRKRSAPPASSGPKPSPPS